MNVIGTARRRVDGRAKVAGLTRFADDLALPRMLYGKLLRSPHPHARLRGIDTAAAAAAPGVVLVLTGADFPVAYGIMPVSQDEHALCRDKVRYVGEPGAAVIATRERAAAAALALVRVAYEPLATIATPEQALHTAEPRIHEYGEGPNVHRLAHLAFGDVEAAARAEEAAR